MAWDKTHRHILEDNRRRHTHIGPVTAVKVGPTYATTFVRGWWINVWKRTQKKTGLGDFFANQVPEEEVRRWRDSGWYDEP